MATKPTASRWDSPTSRIATTPTKRLIVRQYGPQKTGKTHFALTAPGPIFIQSFDVGLEGVVEQFLDAGKDIRAIEYPFNAADYGSETECAKEANKVWAQFTDDYAMALKDGRSVVWDKETEVWELLRYARFGSMSDRPSNYQVLNKEYRSLVRAAYGNGVNLFLIQGTKERWISKFDAAKGKMVAHNTGEYDPAGMKEVGGLVQVNLKHQRVLDDAGDSQYQVVIEDARHSAAQPFVGMTMDNFTFPQLAMACFPDTGEEDWQ